MIHPVTSSRIAFLACTVAVFAFMVPLRAQGLAFKAGAGAAIPFGGAGDIRDPGPAALASLEFGLGPELSFRLDAEWSVLHAPSAPAGQAFRYADVRSVGASLNGVLRSPQDVLTPYLLVGIGAYRLQEIDRERSPYGTTGALQAGIGIDGSFWERVNPFAEARAMVHVTDYASDEFSATVYWPVLIGLRITTPYGR